MTHSAEIDPPSSKVEFANTLRGFAALSVVVSHLYGVFWFNNEAVSALLRVPPLSGDAVSAPSYLYAINHIPLFNAGAYGVALFFLVSGFVIPFSLDRHSAGSFLKARAIRLLPVYAAGFSLSLLTIALLGVHFGTGWPFPLLHVLAHYVPGIRDVLNTTNIDGIIWTLEVEVKFYLACAIVAPLFRRKSMWVFAVPACAFLAGVAIEGIWPGHSVADGTASALMTWVPRNLMYIIFMFCGVLFHYLYIGAVKPEAAFSILLALVTAFGILWYVGPFTSSFWVVWNYAFGLVTFSFAMAFPALFGGTRITDFFARISYPLYVVHAIVGYAIMRLMHDLGISPLVSLLSATLLVIVLAWLLHEFVERPSQSLSSGRRYVRRADRITSPAAE